MIDFFNKCYVKKSRTLAQIQSSNCNCKHHVATRSECDNTGGWIRLGLSVLGVGDDFLPDGPESHAEEEGDEDQDDGEGTKPSSFGAVLSLPVVSD